MILMDGLSLLFVAFITHVIIWRYKKPIAVNRALLIIFFTLPIVLLPAQSFLLEVHYSLPELASLVLLYVSCALVYIILYSAIEMQSPTLAIIDLINQSKNKGCTDDELQQYLAVENAIQMRLSAMQQNDWIASHKEASWQLTKKGRQIGRVFALGATIFGLTQGG